MRLTDAEKWGTLNPNGTGSGAMNLIIGGKADVAIGKFALTAKRSEAMKPSLSYLSSPFVVVVPVGETFTALEKLMKPFLIITWTMVIVVLLTAFLVIAIVTRTSLAAFVLGARNSTPYINTINVLLGGSLPHLPTGTFSRTLLSMFMLYCLVIRNTYTGALFTFIRSDVIRKPTVESIVEMIESDFVFFMIPAAQESTESITQLYSRRSVIDPSDVPKYYEKMNDPKMRAGLVSSLDRIVYFNMVNHDNFTLNVCREHLLSMKYVVYFQKHSHLTNIFDHKLEELQTNGFLSHLDSQYIKYKYLKPAKSLRRPKALELHQVAGSFWILLFGLLTALAVGFLECIVNRCKVFDWR